LFEPALVGKWIFKSTTHRGSQLSANEYSQYPSLENISKDLLFRSIVTIFQRFRYGSNHVDAQKTGSSFGTIFIIQQEGQFWLYFAKQLLLSPIRYLLIFAAAFLFSLRIIWMILQLGAVFSYALIGFLIGKCRQEVY